MLRKGLMMRFSDDGLARCDTRFRVVGRLARLLVALILVGPLAAASSPAGAAVGGADGFEELKKAFLEAAAKKDVPGLFDALEAMELHDSAEKAELLVRVGLSHKDIEVYRESERQLRGLQSPESRAVVVGNALKGKDINLRADCTRILRAHADEAAFEALAELCRDKHWLVRSEACRGLGQFRSKRSVELLLSRLTEEEGRLLDDIVDSLRRLTGQSFGPLPTSWNSWWEGGGRDQPLPEPGADDGTTRKKLGTAVSDGLYGQVVSERVTFLVDVSGSMTAGTELEGTRHEIAIRELVRVLENQLTTDTEFNLIAFADDVVRFAPKLQKAKGKKLDRGIDFVEGLRAGGETNAYGALEAAFSDARVDTIYLLSDGSPTVGDETIPTIILNKVAEWNRYRGVKIHCIGFFPGDARNQNKAEARTFLIDLAQQNRGRYTEVD
jgi:hypothetical protein